MGQLINSCPLFAAFSIDLYWNTCLLAILDCSCVYCLFWIIPVFILDYSCVYSLFLIISVFINDLCGYLWLSGCAWALWQECQILWRPQTLQIHGNNTTAAAPLHVAFYPNSSTTPPPAIPRHEVDPNESPPLPHLL